MAASRKTKINTTMSGIGCPFAVTKMLNTAASTPASKNVAMTDTRTGSFRRTTPISPDLRPSTFSTPAKPGHQETKEVPDIAQAAVALRHFSVPPQDGGRARRSPDRRINPEEFTYRRAGWHQ